MTLLPFLRITSLSAALGLVMSMAACDNSPATTPNETFSETTATIQKMAESDTQAQTAHDNHDNHDHNAPDHNAQAVAADMDRPPVTSEFAFIEAPDDHVMGADDAPVTVIAYASVTCPHCSAWFSEDWPVVKRDLIDTGKIRFVFREFPTQPVQLAMAGFLIANCALEDGFFPSMIHQMEIQADIFEAAKAGNAQQAYLEVAQKAGLPDGAAMKTCLDDKTGYDRIQESMIRAEAAGVRGVPSFFINGEVFEGDSSAAGLIAIVMGLNAGGVSKMDKN